MQKKNFLFLVLGFLAWVFVVSGFFKFVGISSFDRVIANVLGDSNSINNILSILFIGVIGVLVIWGISKITKATA